MKTMKTSAGAVFVGILFVLAVLIPGLAVAQGAAGSAGAAAAPAVIESAQGAVQQAQSLGQLLGVTQPSSGTVQRAMVDAGVWSLAKDTSLLGSTCLEEGATLYLAGHTLTIYGDLTISGKLVINGGKLIILQDTNAKYSYTGNLILEKGLLVMTNAKDSVQVQKAFIANGGDESGKLTAGTLKVNGDFLQLKDYSTRSYVESGTHATVLSGTNKLVQFLSPAGSGISSLTLASGTTFSTADKTIRTRWSYVDAGGVARNADHNYITTGGTFLSLTQPLSANYSITVPNLYYMGSQGSWSLAVNGNLIVPKGTTRSLTGNWSAAKVYVAGTLNLASAGKQVTASSLVSVTGTLNQSAGSITSKDFDAYGVCNISGGALAVTGQYCRHVAVESSSIVASATGSALTVGKDTATAFAVAAPAVNLSGSMAGRTVTVNGALTVPTGLMLDLGSGRLTVSGAMTVAGTLNMKDSSGVVYVNGKYTASGNAGSMTNGYLVLMGDFEQRGSATFRPTGSHKTLLCGGAQQSVVFADPGCAFANLYLLNTSATGPATGELAQTGIKLTGIDVSSGGQSPVVSPAFASNKFSYTLSIPYGATTVSLAAKLQYPNQTVITRVNGTPLAGDDFDGSSDIAIDADGTAVVTLEVLSAAGQPYTAAGAPFSTTYTVTVKHAPLLSAISVTAGGSAVRISPAFASSVFAYSALLPADSGDVIVTAAQVLPGCLSLTVAGQADTYTTAMAPGSSQDIKLIASSGAAASQQATYTVHISKPLVSALTIPAAMGSFTVPFSPDPSVVSAITLPYAVPSVTLTPTGNTGSAGLVAFGYFDGATALGSGSSAAIAVAQGQTRVISVKATYLDTSRTYTVKITREKSNNADLKTLGVSAGWLTAAFNASATSSTLLLPETVSSVTIKPAAADANSKVKIDTLAANTPKTVTLALGGTATTKIVVTALRGNTKTYTLTIRRGAMLTAFSASPVYSGYPSLSIGGTDRLALNYTLSLPAAVKLEVKRGGSWVTILSRTETAPGAKSYSWDGKVNGSVLAKGTYSVRITPVWAGKAGTAKTLTVKILAKPVVTIPSLSPATFTANGTNKLTVKAKWTVLCNVKVEVVNRYGTVVQTLFSASNQAPTTRTLTWNGKNTAGALAAAGTYRIKVTCGGTAAVYKSFTVKR